MRHILDFIWTTRRRALAMGCTHEGYHMGVPVWVEDPDGEMIVAAKSGLLEWVISLGSLMLQFANSLREPGDEILFAFQIRPIEGAR